MIQLKLKFTFRKQDIYDLRITIQTFALDFLRVSMKDRKYSKNPERATINPYSDSEPLLAYVPIPTIIAPRTRRNNPALTGPGILALDIQMILGTIINAITNNIFVS